MPFLGIAWSFLGANLRFLAPIGIVIVLYFYHSYIVSGLNKDINNLKTTMKQNEIDHNATKLALKEKELEVIISKDNISDLRRSIEASNLALESFKIRETELEEEVEKWKQQPPKEVIKYVKRIVNSKDSKNATCEEYKDTNNKISNIRYQDLKDIKKKGME